jgi:tRNA 2-thiouridine synthesizing protein A
MTEAPPPVVSPIHALPLDLSGLKCPLPALRTRKALKSASPGAMLIVTCTDPMAAIDIPNLLRETGDELVRQQRDDDTRLVFLIRKSAG